MNDYLLRVNEASKSFGEKQAVDKVSFEVFPGEILGLLGPNGAGKTTIIRMIMGIMAPDSGEILFSGAEKINKKKLGYLPEERGIYEQTKVLETIVYFAELNNMDQNQAWKKGKEWLKRLDLGEYYNQKIQDLSKGMQQKVQFIISMIHHPRILVLDELFAGLDPVNQDLFKEIVKELVENGITVLLSSHRMNMVEELCDRIFMINEGRRVLYGNLDKIKNDFGLKQVKIKGDGDLEVLRKNPRVSNFKSENNMVRFYIKNDIKVDNFLYNIFSDINIDELSISNPSLHNVFVNSVKNKGRIS